MSSGFKNVGELVDAIESGRYSYASFRKVPSQASTAGEWVDLSMAAGNPKPNYYASSPLVAATLSGIDGIYHGSDKSPAKMYMYEIGFSTPTAGFVGPITVQDILLYYPFIDLDDTESQTLDNTVSLPRYTDGEGVQAMLVCAAPTIGGGSFSFVYDDQDGVEQTSPVQSCYTSTTNIGALVNTVPAVVGPGPYLRLASGSRGIRRIKSFQMSVSNGGLATLVLVKPLATKYINEINSTQEYSLFGRGNILPEIKDGAYLGLLSRCASSLAFGQLSGHAKFAWY